ncbi:hypothetical protein BASA81_012607 [Batrachochytrium salamandrivorans]|nr:hypothetical protein BASA81_012607 [Batrachochytrium salamandrivorans]
MNEMCHVFEASLAEASPGYVAFSWFLFVLVVVVWTTSLPFLWRSRNHPNMRAVRPFTLSVVIVLSNVFWALQILNLVTGEAFPCALVPLPLLMGMASSAINFSLRLVVFGIESQYARQAHLFQHQPDTSSSTGESAALPVANASYLKTMLALCRLLVGVQSLSKLEAGEVVRAKQSYLSLSIACMFPGVITYFIVLGADWNAYVNCINCRMSPGALYGYMAMSVFYAVITGRILYVLYQGKFADEHGVFFEMKLNYWVAGAPLLPIAIVWTVDPGQLELHRQFAYEWLVQIQMLVFWWVSVGMQLVQVWRFPVGDRDTRTTPKPQATLTSEDLCNPQFEAHMIRQLAVEHLYFLQDVHSFQLYYRDKSESWRKQKIQLLFNTYIKPGAVLEINISDQIRRQITTNFQQGRGSDLVFDIAVQDVRQHIVVPLWQAFQFKQRHTTTVAAAAVAADESTN